MRNRVLGWFGCKIPRPDPERDIDEPEDPLIRRIEPENLIRWAAREEQIDAKELFGLGRRREITRVRAICGYLARESARVPLSKIAPCLGGNQSTLWRDVKHLEQEMKESRPVRDHGKRIQAKFVAWGNTT